jgi:hypothetical protein
MSQTRLKVSIRHPHCRQVKAAGRWTSETSKRESDREYDNQFQAGLYIQILTNEPEKSMIVKSLSEIVENQTHCRDHQSTTGLPFSNRIRLQGLLRRC